MDLHSLPITYQKTIPEEYLDLMGHMNVMWYTHLLDEATFNFFPTFGMTQNYLQNSGNGGFALEAHIRYLAEVRSGERVTLRTRILGCSAKRIHFMHFMVKDEGETLASTGELVGTHVNMNTRRTSPYPAHIARAMAEILAQHAQLDWEAPVCGVMGA